ncbi:hypothetical protein [Bacillus thuringiensis]
MLQFTRWLLLFLANGDEKSHQTFEDIAMNQDSILQKAINNI